MNQLALFSVDSQWKWLNTSGNAYLATILRIYYFFVVLVRGKKFLKEGVYQCNGTQYNLDPFRSLVLSGYLVNF